MMFALGTSLTIEDFKRVIRQKRSVGIGLFLQMLFLPLLALGIALFAPLPTEYKIGLFLLSICPGGATSNFISYVLKADTALSVSLMLLNSFLIVFTIPMLTQFILNFFSEISIQHSISMEQTIRDMLLMILLPVGLGILFRHRFTNWAIHLQGFLKVSSSLLLALVFVLKFLEDDGKGISTSVIGQILPYALMLHLLGMMVSYGIAQKVLNQKKSAITIAIEVGLQNTALALWISERFLNNPLMGHPALVYALFSFFTTLGFGSFVLYFNVKTFGKKRV